MTKLDMDAIRQLSVSERLALLIEVYAKRAKDDLTRAVENGLRDVARVLERES